MRSEVVNNILNWWNDNYSLIADYNITEKQILGDKEHKKCRFCGKSEPEVTFRDIAHVIPASLDNKFLFSYYECDDCNHLFGNTIEDHLNKYIFPHRLASIILGRKGKITYKEDEFNRIDVTNGKWEIKETHPHFITKMGEHSIRVNVKRDTYIPIMVYKAFVKMAVCLMPEEEMPFMKNTIAWLLSDKAVIEDYFGKFVIVRTFTGVNKFPFIKTSLFKKKQDELALPEYLFFIAFGNYCYQIIVPCFEKDKKLDGKTVSIKGLPVPFDISSTSPQNNHVLLDFSSHNSVADEHAPIYLHFEREEIKFDLGSNVE